MIRMAAVLRLLRDVLQANVSVELAFLFHSFD